ncbi:hypothetical protein LL946_03350 [Knoellia locipacati]|uniref:hypothetical protein n=1 Tax=Knoellia locipacati TaxID=882824 RepID=UPI00384E5181
MQIRRTLRTIAATSVLLLTGAGVAAAQENTRYSLTFDKEVVATCADGSEVTLYFDITVNRHIREADAEGTALVESRNVNYDGYFTHEDSGEVVEFTGTRVVTIDLVADTFTSRGKYRVVTMPGIGPVMLEAGRYVETWVSEERLFEAGPKVSENPEDPSTFALTCSLFGIAG